MDNEHSSPTRQQRVFDTPDSPADRRKRNQLQHAVTSQRLAVDGADADIDAFRLPLCVVRLDERSKRAVIDGAMRHLSPTEYRLLQLLLSCPGQVFSNDEIIDRLWPERDNATSADVKQYVFLLRQKIERDPKRPRYLLNERGFGYRLADD